VKVNIDTVSEMFFEKQSCEEKHDSEKVNEKLRFSFSSFSSEKLVREYESKSASLRSDVSCKQT